MNWNKDVNFEALIRDIKKAQQLVLFELEERREAGENLDDLEEEYTGLYARRDIIVRPESESESWCISFSSFFSNAVEISYDCCIHLDPSQIADTIADVWDSRNDQLFKILSNGHLDRINHRSEVVRPM